MKAWWCEEHQATFVPTETAPLWSCWASQETTSEDCDFVEMRLVSVGALVIEKVEGEWPDWALTPLRGAFLGVPILDALASAQVGRVHIEGITTQLDPSFRLAIESIEEPPKDPWDYDP